MTTMTAALQRGASGSLLRNFARAGLFLCVTLTLIAIKHFQSSEADFATLDIVLPPVDRPNHRHSWSEGGSGDVVQNEEVGTRRGHSPGRQKSACNDPERRHFAKLVFVHVFKTAGSTLRTFFARYARRCGVGWAEMQCSTVRADSIGSELAWQARNRRGAQNRRGSCMLRTLVRRNGTSASMRTKIHNQLLQNDVDIIGGHIPLGVGKVWPEHDTVVMNETNKNTNYRGVRYVAFFRNALQKYLSGVSYLSRTKGGALANIQFDANRSWTEGRHHSKYATYLITPDQRQIREQLGRNVSKGEEALEIMANLIHFDVSAGITERMPQSIEILQELFDANEVVGGLFKQYGGLLGNSTVRLNPSRMSASTIWSSLKNETDVTAQLVEFVKYEQQVSDFALALHLRQHSSLPGRNSY